VVDERSAYEEGQQSFVEDDPADQQDEVSELGELKSILLGQDRRRTEALAEDLHDLRDLLSDEDTLASMMAPSIADAVRSAIRDNRDQMIEVLYPIIGQTVVRAVAEAVQDLARTVDARVRTSFAPVTLLQRLRARLSGVSEAELALRETLPFEVVEIFLVHRASGLLLRHLSSTSQKTPDSDLVSGMLTAIRDFVQDAFGRARQGQLDHIQYGDYRILVETAQYVYIAVVVDGVEPPGYRALVRQQLLEINGHYQEELRDFSGNTREFETADDLLSPLFLSSTENLTLSATQKRFLWVAFGTLLLCVALTCLGLWLGVAWLDARLTPVVVVVTATLPSPTATENPTETPTPTSTSTGTPSETPTPTASPTSSPTPSPVPTPMATATSPISLRGQTLNVRLNVRSGPGLAFPILDTVDPATSWLILGQSPNGSWLLVCCLPDGSTGWVFADWVAAEGSLSTVPTLAP
jgi:hypothetical protein